MANERRSVRFMLAAVAVTAAAGTAGGIGTYVLLDDGSTTAARTAAVTSASESTTRTAADGTLSVGEVYARASGGVVEITVSADVATPFGGGSEQQAQGSGFVYDDAGHVITNQHVVGGAESVSVRFADGSTYEATVVAADASTDLAVLDVDAPASVLEPLRLGDSETLEVGDAVVAIGSPFGLEGSLTAGIVSGLDREVTSPNNLAIDDAIQTDAALNRGNSGGPLLNMSGEVVGVNAQIESESGGNDGVGFAIPSETVKSVVSQILETGSVEHAYLGVALGDADDGASVTEVRQGTPAARAGLRAGDIVTAVDGTRVASAEELREAIDAKRPGDRATLTVRRDGGTTTVEVTLGERPT